MPLKRQGTTSAVAVAMANSKKLGRSDLQCQARLAGDPGPGYAKSSAASQTAAAILSATLNVFIGDHLSVVSDQGPSVIAKAAGAIMAAAAICSVSHEAAKASLSHGLVRGCWEDR